MTSNDFLGVFIAEAEPWVFAVEVPRGLLPDLWLDGRSCAEGIARSSYLGTSACVNS